MSGTLDEVQLQDRQDHRRGKVPTSVLCAGGDVAGSGTGGSGGEVLTPYPGGWDSWDDERRRSGGRKRRKCTCPRRSQKKGWTSSF